MWPDDPILKHRPAAAAYRLGDRPVPLVSMREALSNLVEGAVGLLAVCELPLAIAPILRAARDNDAAIGLAPAGFPAGPRSRHAFFERVCGTAEQVGTSRPFFLATPPVRVAAYEDAEVASEHVHALVDAGYTGLVVDGTGLAEGDGPGVLARVAQAAVERELGFDVLVEPGEEDVTGELAAALKLLHAAPDLVGVHGGEGVGLAVVAGEVEPVPICWHEGSDDADLRGGVRNAVGAGARLLAIRSPFTREALAALPADLRERLLAAAEAQGGLTAAAASLETELAGLDEDALDRVEARIYAEAEDLIRILRLSGTGHRLRDALTG